MSRSAAATCRALPPTCGGQRPGRKLFGMRVVTDRGRPATVGQAAIRLLVAAVLTALCRLSLLTMVGSRSTGASSPCATRRPRRLL
ncbi:RDD family protein [Nonomuraea dietziae]|uniref:RDD family protein n=1 Tax=Nonomuraea dietziae TaxID=65515 RepID=UPI0033D54F32